MLKEADRVGMEMGDCLQTEKKLKFPCFSAIFFLKNGDNQSV
jgi:hypothetical protein